jgi:hypothetical protein
MSTWFNQDGLFIRYGQKEVEPQKTGVFGTAADGGTHVVETKLDLTALTSTHAIIDEGVYIPKNYILERVEIVTEVAATSGGSATLTIGTRRNSDRTTDVDVAGVVSALALTAMDAVGETTVLRQGSTSAGTKVGAVLSADHVTKLVARANVADFTAGKVTVRMYLRRA